MGDEEWEKLMKDKEDEKFYGNMGKPEYPNLIVKK